MISYDLPAILKRFAEAHHITYPMLSDSGSVVIRKFGILNTNIPPDTRFLRNPVPPGQYLLASNGTVRDKLFLPNFQTRPSASVVLLKYHDIPAAANGVTVTAEDLMANIRLSDNRGIGGQRLGVAKDFKIAPGWPICGEPLAEGYTPTAIKFEDGLVAQQSQRYQHPNPSDLSLLGEVLPAFAGDFKAFGFILLKQRIPLGQQKIAGKLDFQECNDKICKLPQSLRFELLPRIDALFPPPQSKRIARQGTSNCAHRTGPIVKGEL
jgi:hypothetical protein